MDFPREVGNPKRTIVHNEKEYLDYINTNAPFASVYTTVFHFKKLLPRGRVEIPDYRSAVIDRCFFDFDNEDCYEKMKKFHAFLCDRGIVHTVSFSGAGFHIFVHFCDYTFLEWPKDALFNAQKWLADNAELTIGLPHQADLDSAVIGDLARIARIPNTFNHRRKLFCIPLDSMDLAMPFERIKDVAKTQHFLDLKDTVFGTKLFPLKPFDHPKSGNGVKIEIPDISSEAMIESTEGFYPCVRDMVCTESNFKGRFYACIWLRDRGFTKEEADALFKKYQSKFRHHGDKESNYQHMMRHDHTIESVYNQPDRYIFPTCENIFLEGWCKGKCPFFNKHYFHRASKVI